MKVINSFGKLALKIAAVGFVALTLFGCSTTQKVTSYSKDNSDPINYHVEVRNIKVKVDFMEKKDIEEQMRKNLSTKILTFQKELNQFEPYRKLPRQDVFLDLDISQQSFMKDMENYNSVFVDSSLSNNIGENISIDCINRETKSTLVSSVEQDEICTVIFDNISKLLEENYKNCQKLEKDSAKAAKKQKK